MSSTNPIPPLPNEIYLRILASLDPAPSFHRLGQPHHPSVHTLLACTLVSKNFSSLTIASDVWEIHLGRWRHHPYRPPHRRGAAHMAYYIRRAQLDVLARSELLALLRRTSDRLPIYSKLVEMGPEVLQLLEVASIATARECPDDYIALRFWAFRALGIGRRYAAVALWKEIGQVGAREIDFQPVGTWWMNGRLEVQGLVAFASFKTGDPFTLASQLEALDPFARVPHPEFDAPLKEIVLAVWKSMEISGLTPRTNDLDALFINKLLEGMRPEVELEDYHSPWTEVASPEPNLAVSVVLCHLLRTLPPSYPKLRAWPVTHLEDISYISVELFDESRHVLQPWVFFRTSDATWFPSVDSLRAKLQFPSPGYNLIEPTCTAYVISAHLANVLVRAADVGEMAIVSAGIYATLALSPSRPPHPETLFDNFSRILERNFFSRDIALLELLSAGLEKTEMGKAVQETIAKVCREARRLDQVVLVPPGRVDGCEGVSVGTVFRDPKRPTATVVLGRATTTNEGVKEYVYLTISVGEWDSRLEVPEEEVRPFVGLGGVSDADMDELENIYQVSSRFRTRDGLSFVPQEWLREFNPDH